MRATDYVRDLPYGRLYLRCVSIRVEHVHPWPATLAASWLTAWFKVHHGCLTRVGGASVWHPPPKKKKLEWCNGVYFRLISEMKCQTIKRSPSSSYMRKQGRNDIAALGNIWNSYWALPCGLTLATNTELTQSTLVLQCVFPGMRRTIVLLGGLCLPPTRCYRTMTPMTLCTQGITHIPSATAILVALSALCRDRWHASSMNTANWPMTWVDGDVRITQRNHGC